MDDERDLTFVAAGMLGKLAKWLRVLGYDTHYQRFYGGGELERLVGEGRRLLSRHRGTVARYRDAIWIDGDLVGEQMREVKDKASLHPDPRQWFSRCLVCNVLLEDAEKEKARENVPEYVFHKEVAAIRHCPSCGRYYWPGSHRTRMVLQLEKWGFTKPPPAARRSS
jgi:uncharacterized protein with PIN domain